MAVPSTQVGLDPVSSLCTTQYPSNVLTGVFTRLLQEHFASPLSIEYNGQNESAKQLEEYIWNADNTQTRIQIQPVWLYNPQDIQRRPALYVKRNTTKFERLGLDDGWTVNPRMEGGRVIEVRGEWHSKLVVGSYTIFAVGNSGAEAELLGQEVGNHFMMMGPLLRRDLKINRLAIEEIGEVALLEEFEEHFVVPVVIAYAVTATWRIREVAPWLKTLAIDLRANKEA